MENNCLDKSSLSRDQLDESEFVDSYFLPGGILDPDDATVVQNVTNSLILPLGNAHGASSGIYGLSSTIPAVPRYSPWGGGLGAVGSTALRNVTASPLSLSGTPSNGQQTQSRLSDEVCSGLNIESSSFIPGSGSQNWSSLTPTSPFLPSSPSMLQSSPILLPPISRSRATTPMVVPPGFEPSRLQPNSEWAGILPDVKTTTEADNRVFPTDSYLFPDNSVASVPEVRNETLLSITSSPLPTSIVNKDNNIKKFDVIADTTAHDSLPLEAPNHRAIDISTKACHLKNTSTCLEQTPDVIQLTDIGVLTRSDSYSSGKSDNSKELKSPKNILILTKDELHATVEIVSCEQLEQDSTKLVENVPKSDSSDKKLTKTSTFIDITNDDLNETPRSEKLLVEPIDDDFISGSQHHDVISESLDEIMSLETKYQDRGLNAQDNCTSVKLLTVVESSPSKDTKVREKREDVVAKKKTPPNPSSPSKQSEVFNPQIVTVSEEVCTNKKQLSYNQNHTNIETIHIIFNQLNSWMKFIANCYFDGLLPFGQHVIWLSVTSVKFFLQLCLILILTISNVFKFAADESTSHVVFGVFWGSQSILCYYVFCLTPFVCDYLMSFFILPQFTPHLVSHLAIYYLCRTLNHGSSDTSSQRRKTNKRQGSFFTAVVNPTTSSNTVSTDQYASDRFGFELCELILQVICFALPVIFIVEGFHQKNTMFMLLETHERLILAYILSILKRGLILSPITWVGWSVLVLSAVYVPAGFILISIQFFLGLAFIRLVSLVQIEGYTMSLKMNE